MTLVAVNDFHRTFHSLQHTTNKKKNYGYFRLWLVHMKNLEHKLLSVKKFIID
jgi:hypothetical protein